MLFKAFLPLCILSSINLVVTSFVVNKPQQNRAFSLPCRNSNVKTNSELFLTPSIFESTSKSIGKWRLNSSRSSRNRTEKPKRDKFARQKILNPPKKTREGYVFEMDRFKGTLAFGYTTDLVTPLPLTSKMDKESSGKIITKYLSDSSRVALGAWDVNLIESLGTELYRLQVFTIKFVTIELSPHVDVSMWTETETDANGNVTPVFFIESFDFDPKVKLLPGLRISAASLGIDINLAGELRVSDNKKGLTGRIGFTTSGNLPPPLRVLPESALRNAASLINKQIGDFAVRNFQRGSVREFKKFLIEQDKSE